MEAILLFKSRSNLDLEPTSTEQWGQSFLLKETVGTLMGFKLTHARQSSDNKTDVIQPLRYIASLNMSDLL